MKKLILLLLISNCVYSQITDLVSNLNTAGVSNLTYKDNFIYFNSYVEKKVYRFDYTIPNAPLQLVHQFNENPNFVYIKNNNLFVGVESPYKTYKIDISSTSFQPVVIANVAGPMAQFNDDLYIGQYAAAKIVKINLNTSVQTDALTGYKPNFFMLQDNQLYFTSNDTNKLYLFNTATCGLTVLMNNLNYASGIVMNEESFVVCESRSNSISYYSKNNYQFQNGIQLQANSWPNGATMINNDLYFVQTVAGKISKMSLENSLNNTNFVNSDTKINVFPNPSSDVLNIESKYAFEDYKIYDATGRLIKGSNLIDNKINVSDLSKGQYILMLDKNSHNFIKE